MLIIVNATFLINTSRTEPDLLRQLKLATIKSVALEVENELVISFDDFNIEMLQIETGGPEITNERKQRLSSTDVNLLKTCYKHRNRCIMVSDDLQLKNTASENNIKCYTTPEFAAYLFRKDEISRPQCIRFLNVTLPDLIANYLKRKSKEEYLPISAIARKYIAKGVTEELIIEYHRKGYSISRIAKTIDIPIAKVMDVLSRLDEESDVDKDLDDIETSASE